MMKWYFQQWKMSSSKILRNLTCGILFTAGHDTPVVQTPGGTPESDSPEEHKERRLESQRSTDSDKSSPTQGGHPKVKLLVRSHALCDDASPPPEETVTLTTPSNNNTATLSVASLSPTPSVSYPISLLFYALKIKVTDEILDVRNSNHCEVFVCFLVP